MAALGSRERPVIVKVTSEKMAKKVAEICEDYGFQFIAGFEPVENLTDLISAIKGKTAPINIYELCPCGSGAKYKFCCMKKEIVLDL
jgi:uncharacterized protein YecA (UPF0149 family)